MNYKTYIDWHRKKEIGQHSELDENERKLLEELIRNSDDYRKNVDFSKKFIVVWFFISIVCIFFFTNVMAEWRHTGWEWVGSLGFLFTLMGIFLVTQFFIPEIKNSFPDMKKIFEKYNFDETESDEIIVKHSENEKLIIQEIIPQKIFKRKLQKGSEIVYGLRIFLVDLNALDRSSEVTVCYRDSVFASITIDMTAVLKNNKFDLSNESEILKRFNDYFSVKEIISEKNISYENGIFKIFLEKKLIMNALLVCEYLIAVIKACQELEDIYNFPFEPTNEANFNNT